MAVGALAFFVITRHHGGAGLGLFVAAGLPRSEVRLEITAPGFAREVLGPLEVTPGARREMDARLTPEASVSGIVYDPQGNPLSAAVVSLSEVRQPSEAPPGERKSIRIRKRIDSQPGHYEMEQESQGKTTVTSHSTRWSRPVPTSRSTAIRA